MDDCGLRDWFCPDLGDNLLKRTRGILVKSVCGWTRSACFAWQLAACDALRAYKRQAGEVKRVKADKLVSAQSTMRTFCRALVMRALHMSLGASPWGPCSSSLQPRSAGQQVTFADDSEKDATATELMLTFAAARNFGSARPRAQGKVASWERRSEQTYQLPADRMTDGHARKLGVKTSEALDQLSSSNQMISALMELLKKQRSRRKDQPGRTAVRLLQKLGCCECADLLVAVGLCLEEIMDKLGRETIDAFQPPMWTSRISGQNLAGLQLVHFLLSLVLGLSRERKASPSRSHVVQLLRSLSQVCLDVQLQPTATLALPRPVLIYRENKGGQETDVEAVVKYPEALKTIRSQTSSDDAGSNEGGITVQWGGLGWPG